jgi:hypothetical protein
LRGTFKMKRLGFVPWWDIVWTPDFYLCLYELSLATAKNTEGQGHSFWPPFGTKVENGSHLILTVGFAVLARQKVTRMWRKSLSSPSSCSYCRGGVSGWGPLGVDQALHPNPASRLGPENH